MKEDKILLNHIIESIDYILEFNNGITEGAFLKSRMIQDSTIRNFEIIGEATKNISEKTKNHFPDISWRQMAGLRDKLIHDYAGVDLISVYRIVVDILPALKTRLAEIEASV